MAVQKYFIVFLVIVACCSFGVRAQQQQQNESDAEAAQLEIERIVNMCNESFHTSSGWYHNQISSIRQAQVCGMNKKQDFIDAK